MKSLKLLLCLLLALFACVTNCHSHGGKSGRVHKEFDRDKCRNVAGFTDELRNEIKTYKDVVAKIADLVLKGEQKGQAYEDLALFCDSFGPRPSGSESLDNAIKYMLLKFENASLDNVHGEKAMIPKWERGKEWASIVSPVPHKMDILALGTSVGTNGSIIEAKVVEVDSFEMLNRLGEKGEIKGKIVLFNVKFTTYPKTVAYRSSGASKAAVYGAVASLVRSITPYSIYSPHAGANSYEDGVKKIPTAAITLEDADLISRWIKRGKSVKLNLYMEAQNFDNVESQNVIGEIEGTVMKDQIVLVSGHIDSWDITQGAMDDGGGMMISFKALEVLKKLNLKAKRTLRAVLWTSEEFGLWGVKQYFKNRQQDGTLKNFNAVFESDLGTFTPAGLSMAPENLDLSQCIVAEVLTLLVDWKLNKFDLNYEGSDIELFSDVGVPGLSLSNENAKYFYYHHTRGDSMSLEDPDDLDKAVLLWAASSYILADLSISLPRAK